MENELLDKIVKPLKTTNYVDIKLELDDDTYAILVYCQKKTNTSIDEVIKKCINSLREEN